MRKEINHKWFFSHQPEIVWDYLTKPELLELWLMKNDFKLQIGHKFMFTARAQSKFGFDGKIYCEVLDFVPNRRLCYSWKGGPGLEKVTLDSLVTWTITPKDGGTELLLKHTGFNGAKNYLAYLIMNKGWAKIGKRLSKNLEK